MSDTTFAGQVVVVTGGSRGIGRTIALEFAKRGADIAFGYLRSHRVARETTAEIEALGVRCFATQANVGDPKSITRFFQQISDLYGRVDVLVNNAASGIQRPALELEAKHWDWTMNINARGPFLCTKEAAPLMIDGGSVVSISSLGSQRVLPFYLSVGVSKGALETLTRYLAVELAPLGIRVNAVSGGYVETNALEHFPNKDDMLASARQKTPAGRMVTQLDIALATIFLCSPAAEMIRGQVLAVDGGVSLLP